MKVSKIIHLLFFVFLFNVSNLAQNPKVRYHFIGEITKCEKCGRWGEDIWEGKFRIENISKGNLIIYGNKYSGEFSPSSLIQRRNSDVCEWKYGNGRAKYATWNERSSLDKQEQILKPNQFIDIEFGLNEFDFNESIRFTAYIAAMSGEEPDEVFSEAFILQAEVIRDENGKLLKKSKITVFFLTNYECYPCFFF